MFIEESTSILKLFQKTEKWREAKHSLTHSIKLGVTQMDKNISLKKKKKSYSPIFLKKNPQQKITNQSDIRSME